MSDQACGVDSSGAESTSGESEDSEHPARPSEDHAVGPRKMSPLKGQYETAQLQDLTL